MFVEPDPFVFVEEGFTCEGPTLNIEQLLLVAIALKHDVALFANSLDFAKGGLKFENAEVVERGEGDNKIEGLVLERIWILSAVDKEIGLESFSKEFKGTMIKKSCLIKLLDVYTNKEKRVALVPAVVIDKLHRQFLIEISIRKDNTTIRLFFINSASK